VALSIDRQHRAGVYRPVRIFLSGLFLCAARSDQPLLTNPEWWMAFFAGVGAISPFILGFGWWMFRIDRAIGRVAQLGHTLDEFKRESIVDRDTIWNRINDHEMRLGSHGERLSAAEAKLEFRPPRGR